MKFAHEFQAALIREGYPSHWVESAVPYGQLKKCIKKVAGELRSFGLDSTTLAQLIPNPDLDLQTQGSRDAVAFEYDFDGDSQEFRPKLTLFVQVEDGLAVDATLSPSTRRYLESLVSTQQGGPGESLDNVHGDELERQDSVQGGESALSGGETSPRDRPVIQRVEIPLTFDAEFFDLLHGDVTSLDTLQAGEQKAIASEIDALSKQLTILTKPSKFSKTDLNRWRELLDIYVQAGIFFSTNELDHGSRNSTVALRQLQWFQTEVTKRRIVESFKLSASRQALDQFVSINVTLLRNLKFKEINQLAITKILKKFDKTTKLGATRTFPRLIQSDSIMSEKMAKAVCSQVTQDLVKLVPQLDDYMCPICFTVCWRPIRVRCNHIFCIRCMVELQRPKLNKPKPFCPLCREDVIMEADEDNIDPDLANFLQKYFPKETRQKQIEMEIEAGREQFGPRYKHPSESKCIAM